VVRLTSGGPVLGVLANATYESGTVAFGPGDRLILYTDGITEARSEKDDEFGDERLLSLAVEHRACSAPALQARLVDAVATFTGRRFADDATLIVLAADN
jgi:sigma-B regulation protein RsbU (phosphoserine phosphatase)